MIVGVENMLSTVFGCVKREHRKRRKNQIRRKYRYWWQNNHNQIFPLFWCQWMCFEQIRTEAMMKQIFWTCDC